MKIEKVTITNFRCFGPAGVALDFESDVTAIVGNNGSGKTAIFAALSKMFGVSTAQRTIHKTDFHVPLEQEGIETGTELSIDCVFGFPSLEGGQGEPDDAVPEVFSQMATAGEDEPLKVRMLLRARWVEDGTPDGTIEEEVRWIPALDNDFTWDECQKVGALERGYIQLIYVPASRNAADQVTSLLKGRLWRAARWSQNLSSTATQGAQRIQECFDQEAPARFISERLERRWSEVHKGDTATKPILRLVEPGFAELVRRAEFVFFPDEAAQTRPLDSLSDGQRSLFHIALTAATLEIERDALAVPPEGSVFDQERLRRTYLTILAIEEPENSLSPFFLSRIMNQARDIGAMDGAQVIVSSHSASILSRIEPKEVRYTRLNDETRSSSVKGLTLPADGSEASRYIRLAVKAYPELYFARFVILAEGESEGIVLPRVAEAMGFPLDRSFVPIVPLGGRFVTHFWRLLTCLEIPFATLLDLDLGRRHGGAERIAYIVHELAAVGRTMERNRLVRDGEVNLDEVDEIDDVELCTQDQNHPWLKALRLENVYFSSPIDLDFAMISLFEEYRRPFAGGHGPRNAQDDIERKKAVTLKTGGNPELYEDGGYDESFVWYPYLFIGHSKPEVHIAALGEISSNNLAENAPVELRRLINKVRKAVEE